MSKSYLILSYIIGASFFAVAFYLTMEWIWLVRLPLMAYLALCTFLFPFSRLPADITLSTMSLWSPFEVHGILVWALLAVTYIVVWALGVIFAPIGAVLHFSGKRRAAASQDHLSR